MILHPLLNATFEVDIDSSEDMARMAAVIRDFAEKMRAAGAIAVTAWDPYRVDARTDGAFPLWGPVPA